MDDALQVIDLSLLLEKATVKGAPPYNIQRLGIAVLSPQYMSECNIRLGQPIRVVPVSSCSDSSVSSVKEDVVDALIVSFEQTCTVRGSSDKCASSLSSTYSSPSFLLLTSWPLSFLPRNVVALDSWSCSMLFMDAYRKQLIHDTTLQVASQVKQQLSDRASTTKVASSRKKKSPKRVESNDVLLSVYVRITDVYREEEQCRVCDRVVWRIVGFGPPSLIGGQLEPVDSDLLKEKWYDDIHFESYVRSIVSKRYIVPGSWLCISKDGWDLYLVCHRVQSENGDEFFTREYEDPPTSNLLLWKVVACTKMEWLRQEEEEEETGQPHRTLEPSSFSLGGVDELLEPIKSFCSICCFDEAYRETLSRIGIQPSRGLLLYGPPGTGKSTLAQAVASSMPFHTVRIVRAPSIISSTFGETESHLIQLFQLVGSRVPSILVIDEIDALGVSRDSKLATEAEWRLTRALISCIDGMPKRMVLLATTSRLESLDAALRRPGRFDMELEVGAPNSWQRFCILRQILAAASCMEEKTTAVRVELAEDDLKEFCNDLHGYVGADIVALWRESLYLSYHRWKNQSERSFVVSSSSSISVTMDDLRRARQKIFPSAWRSDTLSLQVAKVGWEDIGGYDQVKRALKEAIEWPHKYADAFRRFGISPIKGILLYGPPGCSKTLMAKALANETSCHFLSVKGPELFQKWVGESEKAVRNLFRKAKSVAPCILFFDELDALAARRQDESSSHAEQRVLAQLLTEMDGISSSSSCWSKEESHSSSNAKKRQEDSWIFVLGATNRPDLLDPALIRPGRFDRLVYVGLPDSKARERILRIHCRRMPLNESLMDWNSLVEATRGMTGAELASLCREATLNAMKEQVATTKHSNIDQSQQQQQQQVEYRHFQLALEYVKPRTSSQLLTFYVKFANDDGDDEEVS